jgi:hypothetical protein
MKADVTSDFTKLRKVKKNDSAPEAHRWVCKGVKLHYTLLHVPGFLGSYFHFKGFPRKCKGSTSKHATTVPFHTFCNPLFCLVRATDGTAK